VETLLGRTKKGCGYAKPITFKEGYAMYGFARHVYPGKWQLDGCLCGIMLILLDDTIDNVSLL
jgi:hypothetical protein